MQIKVVIVDDDEEIRGSLAALIRRASYLRLLGEYANAESALKEIPRHPPDVVLMDYRMPGLDGARSTRAVLEASPSSRVVCLTASVSTDERDHVLAAGAVACLMKDEGLDRIVEAILEAALT